MTVKSSLRKAVHLYRRAWASLGINQWRYKLHKPFCHRILDRPYETARERLESYSPRPEGTVSCENRLEKPFSYDLQIVIPAYNAEAYLADALESVVSQKTEYTYCVFLIDDGSTDKTFDICESYKSRENFYVIHQENGGFSDARNQGLKTILGQYVMFLDSDDLLVEGAVQALLDTAYKNHADIVQGGSYALYDGHRTVRNRCSGEEKVDAEKAFEGMAWAKVYRSELFKDIRFPKDFWFEDTITCFLLYPLCKTAYVIPNMAYVYRMHQKSITHTFSGRKKTVDTLWITEEMLNERKKREIPDSASFLHNLTRQIILNYKRLSKLPLDVQENAFIVERELLLSKEALSDVCGELYSAILKKDFDAYRNYCRFH